MCVSVCSESDLTSSFVFVYFVCMCPARVLSAWGNSCSVEGWSRELIVNVSVWKQEYDPELEDNFKTFCIVLFINEWSTTTTPSVRLLSCLRGYIRTVCIVCFIYNACAQFRRQQSCFLC